MVFVFIYIYCYPTRFPYQMIFVSLISNSNPSGAPEVTPYCLSEVPVAQSLIFYVIFCRQSSILFLLAIAFTVFLWVAASEFQIVNICSYVKLLLTSHTKMYPAIIIFVVQKLLIDLYLPCRLQIVFVKYLSLHCRINTTYCVLDINGS
jgi:hypothetical protein